MLSTDGSDHTVPVPLDRLQALEACEQRAALDARTIELLQTRNHELEAALAEERKRGESMACAFADVARMSDARVSELVEAHNARLASVHALHDAALAAKDAAVAEAQQRYNTLERAVETRIHELQTTLEAALGAAQTYTSAHLAAIRAAAVQLTAIQATMTAPLALEIHPVRHDRRQFATRHSGPVPVQEFDGTWCAAACGKDKWKVNLDATGMRAHVTAKLAAATGHLVLRGAIPLRRHLRLAGAVATATDRPRGFRQLPSYRVIIEAYHEPQAYEDGITQRCNVGFLPSHTVDGARVVASMGQCLSTYGGWFIQVTPSSGIKHSSPAALFGWTPLPPRRPSAKARKGTSAYATTVGTPPVPAGSAVEFSVDYAAGTCRVAFYTPEAVAGGFVDPPHAKMELRFVATPATTVEGWGAVPARSVPTSADPRVQLHPAIGTQHAGAIYRFAD